jgi:hypothetical protein
MERQRNVCTTCRRDSFEFLEFQTAASFVHVCSGDSAHAKIEKIFVAVLPIAIFAGLEDDPGCTVWDLGLL